MGGGVWNKRECTHSSRLSQENSEQSFSRPELSSKNITLNFRVATFQKGKQVKLYLITYFLQPCILLQHIINLKIIKGYLTFFSFLLSLWNLVCSLRLQHILTQASHVSRVQWPHVVKVTTVGGTVIDPLIVMWGQEKMRLEKNLRSTRDSWSRKCPIPQCTELSFHMSPSRTNMSFGLWEIAVWNQKTLSKVPEFQIQNSNIRSIMENTKYLLSTFQAQETTLDAVTNMSKLRINF